MTNFENSLFFINIMFLIIHRSIKYLKKTGFLNYEIIQTVFEKQTKSIQPFRAGFGEGSFVVIKTKKI